MKDIIIIGSGIIGVSIARELSRYNASILVLEKNNDVSCGTTKANSGIVHAGYDALPGTKKAKFNVEGAKMYPELSKELEFPYKKNGAFVLSFTEDGLENLNVLLERGKVNGVSNLEIISGDKAREIEPNLSKEVKYALYAKDSGIVSPYEMAIAVAESACTNGVEFAFEEEVVSVSKFNNLLEVNTKSGKKYFSKVVINAAGVYADKINNMISKNKYEIEARKGEYCLLDKEFSYITKTTLFQLPNKMGKGILVAPSTHENILIGPTAVSQESKDDVSTSYDGLKKVWDTALLSVPSLPKGGIIAQFSGLRAHIKEDDYVIGFSDVEGFYNCLGIESPGLASSPAIAKHVAKEIKDFLSLEEKSDFISHRSAIKRVRDMSDAELEQTIKENPNYGHIICRCEVVSEAEIREAIRRKPGAKDLDGVKRRTRAGMGRCQMGFCTPRVMQILSEELGISMEEITKKGKGSNLLVGRIKQ